MLELYIKFQPEIKKKKFQRKLHKPSKIYYHKTVNDIDDIFYENNKINLDTFGMHMVYISHLDSNCGRISSLAEIFLEWYLFDSSEPKDIKLFLAQEELADIFTEQEFIDLIYGKAYLDNTLLQVIELKLPFFVSPDKIRALNKPKDKSAYLIKSGPDIINKIQKILKQKQEQKKKSHYESNHKYFLSHREEALARITNWVKNNPERNKEAQKIYRKKNAAAISASKKKCYYAKQEQYRKRIKQNYEKNKERYLAQQKQYNQEMRRKSELAKQICATYVFLVNLRKNNKKEYLNMYTKNQRPLIPMLKTCTALQNMDINMCPLCNENCENKLEKCCNQKVLAIPNVMQELQTIANKLKQR